MAKYKKLTIAEMEALLKDPSEKDDSEQWRDGVVEAFGGD